MKKFKLTLFGGFHLTDRDGEPLTASARKSKALLAWLAVNPDKQHLREKLAAVLWPDSDDVQGRHSLRQALAELRKIMPDDAGPLRATKDWILLDSSLIEVDVLSFNRALAQGDAASLDQAVEDYRGEFLEGCNPHSDAFDEWLSVYRQEYSVKATAAIEQRLETLLEEKAHERAAHFALRLLAIDPLQEKAYRALMRAYDAQGQEAAALRWYRKCRHVLQRELGVEPQPQTEALHAWLLETGEGYKAGWDTLRDMDAGYKAPACATCGTADNKPRASTRERFLYLATAAIEGILDRIGGQCFLLRGESTRDKHELVEEIAALAHAQGFACCRRNVADFSAPGSDVEWRGFINGSAKCLLKQPLLLVVEDIHRAGRETLKLLAGLIAEAGGGDILLLMTSRFEGEPLDPLWRGAMRGAPLTTLDL